jgi:large subunit ribosomal protein L21
MYAVIKTGGKQHKVKAGDVIEVEYIHGADDGLTFKPLLVVDDDGKTHVGRDLDKAVVKAKAAGEQKGEKVRIFKYKNKTGYSRRQGHRQLLTLLEISDVSLGSGAAKKIASTKDKAPAEAEAPAEP